MEKLSAFTPCSITDYMMPGSQINREWTDLPERRSVPRVPLTAAVLKTVGEERCLCQAVDISPTGMSMRRAKGLPLSTDLQVFLKFSLPGSEEVHRIRAVVVREESDGRFWASAVTFGPLPDRLRRRIDSYVAQGAHPTRG